MHGEPVCTGDVCYVPGASHSQQPQQRLAASAPLCGYQTTSRLLDNARNDITGNASVASAAPTVSRTLSGSAADIVGHDPWQTVNKYEGKIAFDGMTDALGQEVVFYHDPPPPPTTDRGKIWDRDALSLPNPRLSMAQGYDVHAPERHKTETYTPRFQRDRTPWEVANDVNEEMRFRAQTAIGMEQPHFQQYAEGAPVGHQFTNAVAFAEAARHVVPTQRGEDVQHYPGHADVSGYLGVHEVQQSLRELESGGHYARRDRAWNYPLQQGELAYADPSSGGFREDPIGGAYAAPSSVRQGPDAPPLAAWTAPPQWGQQPGQEGHLDHSDPYRGDYALAGPYGAHQPVTQSMPAQQAPTQHPGHDSATTSMPSVDVSARWQTSAPEHHFDSVASRSEARQPPPAFAHHAHHAPPTFGTSVPETNRGGVAWADHPAPAAGFGQAHGNFVAPSAPPSSGRGSAQLDARMLAPHPSADSTQSVPGTSSAPARTDRGLLESQAPATGGPTAQGLPPARMEGGSPAASSRGTHQQPPTITHQHSGYDLTVTFESADTAGGTLSSRGVHQHPDPHPDASAGAQVGSASAVGGTTSSSRGTESVTVRHGQAQWGSAPHVQHSRAGGSDSSRAVGGLAPQGEPQAQVAPTIANYDAGANDSAYATTARVPVPDESYRADVPFASSAPLRDRIGVDPHSDRTAYADYGGWAGQFAPATRHPNRQDGSRTYPPPSSFQAMVPAAPLGAQVSHPSSARGEILDHRYAVAGGPPANFHQAVHQPYHAIDTAAQRGAAPSLNFGYPETGIAQPIPHTVADRDGREREYAAGPAMIDLMNPAAVAMASGFVSPASTNRGTAYQPVHPGWSADEMAGTTPAGLTQQAHQPPIGSRGTGHSPSYGQAYAGVAPPTEPFADRRRPDSSSHERHQQFDGPQMEQAGARTEGMWSREGPRRVEYMDRTVQPFFGDDGQGSTRNQASVVGAYDRRDSRRAQGGSSVGFADDFPLADPSQGVRAPHQGLQGATRGARDPTRRGHTDASDFVSGAGSRVREEEEVSSREAYALGMTAAAQRARRSIGTKDRSVDMLTDYDRLRSPLGDMVRGGGRSDPRTLGRGTLPPSPLLNFGHVRRRGERKNMDS